ncbi:hypothetical protein BATDEDRAFT_87718 [Batrachochytrium dendrobatidis JAM81]|uniref:UspA domain-containing protein n=2 Tax=Batrachochytrium dendrobatidis TaxID=109871 RepID=F4P016_BATDJ|nr:uncharacterized protein BATDEDRAFT_87718 [Batrachochytrium dendrobatidis JAM81]EGF81494.1 hypothetical protein BATDEDRAFT_87718 [Batrachochytrium dendrobatidis JAM81]KAJ8326032.1 hypothetical protein O5D80_005667 [Batrachochytrium dendrobatidis]KAK5670019.1 hypothetical protein QVD99_003508 [Batrachochytrium dendrobatidis]OAJ38341.1 hypothetical protein BDEG_22286 [Batrachochytrium dendrobatidis JEL423]|eukprot:XP_006678223.1 hypothetical protein BATDEDRAFT_87718 [Batrachochytrium dendrobatidis JAM81]
MTDTPTKVNTPNMVHEVVHEHPSPDLLSAKKRVVCIAIDGSQFSDHAISWALENVLRKETDQVVLLNVRPYPLVSMVSTPLVDYSLSSDQEEASNKSASHRLLVNAANTITLAGFSVRAIALRGDAREELDFKIRELKADLVVIGSRGLSTFKRLLLGSVSAHLANTLTVPLLITRGPTTNPSS